MEKLPKNYPSIPVIDLTALLQDGNGQEKIAGEIHDACRSSGFFYLSGHQVDLDIQQQLEILSKEFFDLPEILKQEIRMELGGKAWRGYFPVGAELTSGKPDVKEGIYFGEELNPDHHKVREGILLHGQNLFPVQLPGLKKIVLEYMSALKQLGHYLMRGLSLSLGLDPQYIYKNYTFDPLCLFRIFHYPPVQSNDQTSWGVGEHTDYGLLTILKQDAAGGLQIRVADVWIDAPYIKNTFICNIGDMLEKLTGGYYRSTPHRVRNSSGQERYSFPFFFDPAFDATISPIDMSSARNWGTGGNNRWDHQNIHDYQGTYGEYLISKVSKVFPALKTKV